VRRLRLISLIAVLIGGGLFVGRAAKVDLTYLQAPDSTAVQIQRDSYGVPHITGDTETAVFFGQGFAVAEDRLVQLETYRRSAEGKLAEWFGKSYLPLDEKMRTMLYTRAERQAAFRQMSLPLQKMYEAYTAGINTYLDSIKANPERYRPREFEKSEIAPWEVEDVVAVVEFATSVFGQFGGEELTRLAERQINGQEWLERHRPLNDPDAPATIRDESRPAEPHAWHYSGIKVRTEAIREISDRWKLTRDLIRHMHMPLKFGSFAVLISPSRSQTGNALLLGCPQMGAPRLGQTNTIHEVELDCPTLHVGGMALAGMPGIIIGRNDYLAWTLTSGYSDNCDVYVDSTQTAGYGRYYYKGAWHEFEAITDTIYVEDKATVFTHYRTVHGPVIGADLENHQVFTLKTTFHGCELDMAQSLYQAARAWNMESFQKALAINPMSFNVFCASSDGRIKYWHIGKYQNRADGVDPRLPHKGDGSEEWAGFIPFDKLPSADGSDQDYFVSWNNKPVSWWDQGDNIPWVGENHVRQIEEVVAPATEITYDRVRHIPERISDHGTYQQVFELRPDEWRGENIVPPGQSAFVDLSGQANPHSVDQWSLHSGWQFKEMEFSAPWNQQQNSISSSSSYNDAPSSSPVMLSRLIADRWLESGNTYGAPAKVSVLKTGMLLHN
jgi:penicillin amidase